MPQFPELKLTICSAIGKEAQPVTAASAHVLPMRVEVSDRIADETGQYESSAHLGTRSRFSSLASAAMIAAKSSATAI